MDLTRTGVMLGTPYYMSPEQARGERSLDYRVDLYAVGVILYETLSGRMPFDGANYHALLRAIIAGHPLPLQRLAPHIPLELAEIIHRAMALDPKERFLSADEMQEAIQPFAVESSMAALRATFSDQTIVDDTMPERARMLDAKAEKLEPKSSKELSTSRVGRLSRDVENSEELLVRDTLKERWGNLREGSQAPEAKPPPASEATRKAEATQESEAPKERRSFLGRALRSLMPPAKADALPPLTPAPGTLKVETPPPRGPKVLPRAPSLDAPREAVQSLDTAARALPPAKTEPKVRAPQSTTEVRGSVLLGVLHYVTQRYGSEAVAPLLEKLPSQARSALAELLLPMVWFPADHYHLLLDQVEQRWGDAEGSVAFQIGAFIAERDLPTTHRVFMQGATPVSALKWVPRVWRSYCDQTSLSVVPLGKGSCRLEYSGTHPASFLHDRVTIGFCHRLMELVGAQEVKTQLIASQGRGAERTLIGLQWS